jgi:hypothetical protein
MDFKNIAWKSLKLKKSMPLDYIMVLPKVIMKILRAQTRTKLEKDFKEVIDGEIKKQRTELNRQGLTMNKA